MGVTEACLPEEVAEALYAYLDGKVPSAKNVRFFLKAKTDRATAWWRVDRNREGTWNPWRKCHTENYWVWYQTEERRWL